MKHKGWVIGLFGVAIIVGVFVMNPDLINQANVGTPIISDGSDPNKGKIQAYGGPIDMDVQLNDAISTGTTYTDSTEADINYYLMIDGEPNFITQSASGSVAITPAKGTSLADPGDVTVWAEVVIPSAQDFLVDAAGISKHSKVGNPTWCDWNDDNVHTYCFPIDISGINELAEDPHVQWIVKLYDEGTITLDSPDEIRAIGTGKANCDIDWDVTIASEGDATYITNLRITANQTDSDMWFPNESWLKLAGEQKTFSSADDLQLASTFQYDWDIADDYPDGKFISFPINGEDEYNFNARIKTNFDAAGEGITWTIRVTEMDAQGAVNHITDAVKCLEA